MIACAKPSLLPVHRRPNTWFRAAAFAIFLSTLLPCRFAEAQSTNGNGANISAPSSVHGTVLNRVTHQPIARALVFSVDQQYAVLTDDRGRFEFKFPPPESEPVENPSSLSDPVALRARHLRLFRNSRPHVFQARKPGFLQGARNPSIGREPANLSEITIFLDPESLIVGYVIPQDSAGDLRFHLELYRRELSGGLEHWAPAGTFTTWADSEFRFSNLSPGAYKLVTHEQLDRDPFTFTPGAQLFGYMPIFYPGTSDFSAATAIQLAAGETFQANVSPTLREYYPIKIPVANAPGTQPVTVRVYPLGHPGPGYSLGFNPAEQLIQGMLPDGNYTLQAETQGQPGSTGVQDFSVHGTALEGPTINLIPNPLLTANVKEEFKSGQSVFDEGPADLSDGPLDTAGVRRTNIQVMLIPTEDFGPAEGGASQPVEGTQEHALAIQNVRPGRYRVRVETGVGFASSVLSGGTDLLREPLVVGMGSNSPIEVTLRDDGAEVKGVAEDATISDHGLPEGDDARPQCYVYFLPIAGNTGQFREASAGPDGTFTQEQLPPGTYRVLAFGSPQEDLAYASEEVLRKLESQGQIIHLAAGQKEHLRLKTIPRGDSQ